LDAGKKDKIHKFWQFLIIKNPLIPDNFSAQDFFSIYICYSPKSPTWNKCLPVGPSINIIFISTVPTRTVDAAEDFNFSNIKCSQKE